MGWLGRVRWHIVFFTVIAVSLPSVFVGLLARRLLHEQARALGLVCRDSNRTVPRGRLPSLPPSESADSLSCTPDQKLLVAKYTADLATRTKAVRQASHLIKSDSTSGCELWDTPHGRYWVVEGNMDSFAEALAEEDNAIYDALQGGVRSGDIVLDCGAHLGAFTRAALKHGAAQVVAIDLSPRNIRCLSKTFAGEIQAGRVKVCPKGVWDKDDELTLYEDGQTIGDSVVLQKQSKGRKVQLTSIDKLVQELRLSRVDFIKMDIEGAEVRALRGASQTLRRYRPRMAISAHHLVSDPHDVPWAARLAVPDYWMSSPTCMHFVAERPIVTMFR
jgi:FkbM family methyltransferase